MRPFWEGKSLAEMSEHEWELLCDGCGKCCLHKLIDADEENTAGGESLYYTDVRCRYLNPESARCGCYSERLERVSNCVNITLADLPKIHFMPPSCAYRRLHEGLGLPEWHPLRHGGSTQPMKEAHMSVSCFTTVNEQTVDEDDYETRIVSWPLGY